MLQCVPLADSCLALGQASCRRARELANQYAAQGVLHGTKQHIHAAAAPPSLTSASVPVCRRCRLLAENLALQLTESFEH